MFNWLTGPRITNVIEDLQTGTPTQEQHTRLQVHGAN